MKEECECEKELNSCANSCGRHTGFGDNNVRPKIMSAHANIHFEHVTSRSPSERTTKPPVKIWEILETFLFVVFFNCFWLSKARAIIRNQSTTRY